ncbi:glutathione peroxidase [Bacteroidota bacterium]
MKRIIIILSALFLTGILAHESIAQGVKKLVTNHPVYAYKAKTIDGEEISLEQYKGKVLLIVNVASKCGYTPQYKGLQELYEKYNKSGFEILGFPCNQFRGQEPGNNAEIKEFCSTEYGVTFPMFSKIEVNGEEALPLYQYLTDDGGAPIRWNFEKFLVNFMGIVVKKFGTKVTPEELAPAIEKQLKMMNN